MEFKKWFSKDPPVEPDQVEIARKAYAPLTDLAKSHGWALVKGFLIDEVNASISKWMAGVDDRTQLRLGARIEALGWAMDIVDNKIQLYSIMLKHIEEESSMDDGTTPLMDPHEDLE